jgi:hypothetical protein
VGDVLEAIEARDDLAEFGSNRSALFALQIEFQLEDIRTVAADALVDGPDDKGCDLFYIDDQSGRAIISQTYEACPPREAAKASKAGDLSQTVQWLIATPLGDVPERLQAAARDLRDQLEGGALNAVELWYVHNCPESKNVAAELERAKMALRTAVDSHFPESRLDTVAAREIGSDGIQRLYASTQVAIEVSDTLQIPIRGHLNEQGGDWTAVYCSVPGAWLRELYNKHKDKLFSANVRGYLGSKRSDKNINNGIKETASSDANDFWVFNNGITALVNNYDVSDSTLTVSGMAIVNGAQTTGSIASSEADLREVRVMARFVRCHNPDTIRQIIRFNNRQNKIEPADFRSNDQIQERLRAEFEQLGHLQYSGGRRGGADDIIRRPGDREVSASSAAQALAAFHGDPDLAYNRKTQIWDSDRQYSRFFREETTARHILFAYSLLKQIDDVRLALRRIPDSERTGAQQSRALFLSQRGASHLLVAAVAEGLETTLSRRIASRFDLQFVGNHTLDEAKEIWRPIVEVCLSLHNALLPATEQGLKNTTTVAEVLANFTGQLEAVRIPNESVFASFAERVRVA